MLARPETFKHGNGHEDEKDLEKEDYTNFYEEDFFDHCDRGFL